MIRSIKVAGKLQLKYQLLAADECNMAPRYVRARARYLGTLILPHHRGPQKSMVTVVEDGVGRDTEVHIIIITAVIGASQGRPTAIMTSARRNTGHVDSGIRYIPK